MKSASITGWLIAMLLVVASLSANICEASCVPSASMHGGGLMHACCAHGEKQPGVKAMHASTCHHAMKEEMQSVRPLTNSVPAPVLLHVLAPAAFAQDFRLQVADAGPPRMISPPVIPLRI
ncbi:hypothetical protein [Silvibacterium dinghuense]|uniref:Uncharacterized protein n=1 Tax=Silvibacterium dinghuense TaxID=1560006 RepID=A0A4Q1S8A0_9BACT|nr:hypothetical protein [Silvibacterium dinghuense]RXS93059.1 hypothetical protein ESZ00_19725 [Silvibacterium dinghuense]GGG89763.1 hypothetical protein GCM10011586_00190 [Silvibacterium dinghuense]